MTEPWGRLDLVKDQRDRAEARVAELETKGPSMTPEDAAKLRAEFPRSAIGQLPKPTRKDAQKGNCNVCGGYHGLPAVHLDYVGHAAATDRLIAVDPCWTWEPYALTEAGLPALDRDGNLWIRLTICGVTRPGVGDGANMKERIGDAIRNAAMRFGVALDLWAKEDLHDTQGAGAEDTPATPRKTTAKKAAVQPEAGGRNDAPAPVQDRGPDATRTAPPASTLSDAQMKKMRALYGTVGIKDAAGQKATSALLLGIPTIGTHATLTPAQAGTIIDRLTAVEAGFLEFVTDEQGVVTGTIEGSAPTGHKDIPPHPGDAR